jgi:hypothetical protein
MAERDRMNAYGAEKVDKRETMRTTQQKPKIGDAFHIEDKRISPPICNNGRRNLR